MKQRERQIFIFVLVLQTTFQSIGLYQIVFALEPHVIKGEI